jgi:peroxiredoxin
MKTISLRSFVAVSSFVLACFAAAATAQAAAIDVGSPAPTWKLKDMQGKTISSADFKGKVVVVDFWATWCPPCVSEIPGYIELQKKYADQGLVFVGLSVDQAGPEVVNKFIADHHVNYDVALADEKTASAFGGFEAIPTTFVIDRTGHIANMKTGSMPEAAFEALLEPLLKAPAK